MESNIQNRTVILPDSSKRSLDMDAIIESVKNQYANMAARSREEAEQWNQRKVRRITQKQVILLVWSFFKTALYSYQ